MKQNFNVNITTTASTANIDNSGDAERSHNISARANYLDGKLNQVIEGECVAVADAEEGEVPASRSTFSRYGQLTINFAPDTDVAATAAAITQFVADIAELD